MRVENSAETGSWSPEVTRGRTILQEYLEIWRGKLNFSYHFNLKDNITSEAGGHSRCLAVCEQVQSKKFILCFVKGDLQPEGVDGGKRVPRELATVAAVSAMGIGKERAGKTC